jgi:hypothetical protein
LRGFPLHDASPNRLIRVHSPPPPTRRLSRGS